MTAENFLTNKGINTLTVKGFQTDNTAGKQAFWTAFAIMDEYARIKCKEQRELCAENSKTHLGYVVKSSIITAPEPKF